MYLQMSDVLLLEIHVHSQRNVLNGFRDYLHIHELSGFPEVSRSYFEPTVMFLRPEITG